ncbi:hypothetical protein ACHQM5_022412 [Ranunculus cassubicifolius]
MGSPSSSSSDPNPSSSSNPNRIQWWEAISKARSRIQSLSSILPSFPSILSHADTDRPARSLLESQDAYFAVSSSLSQPLSGSGDDPLCQWLYETYQSSDPNLRLVVLSFIPLLTGLYLSRVIVPSFATPMPSLSGFEAVILALYASETKARAGKPTLISIPDLSQPSLYHSPQIKTPHNNSSIQSNPTVGILCPPLEPQIAIKSTKRAFIVSVALDCYYKQISQMPSWSKLDFCQFVSSWAGQNCSCRNEFDSDSNGSLCDFKDFEEDIEIEIDDTVEKITKLGLEDSSVSKGARVPLPWELLQPLLRILGHCLMAPLNSQDVKDAAAYAVRCLYARASHDLLPQAILATRSLIQLDVRLRLAAKAAADAANATSNANTPSKARRPEVLLVSK